MKKDKNVSAYIDKKHNEFIKSEYEEHISQGYSPAEYKDEEKEINFFLSEFLPFYDNVVSEKLRDIFAFFHQKINNLIEQYVSSSMHEQQDEYIEEQLRVLFFKLARFQDNLEDSNFYFIIDEKYRKFVSNETTEYFSLRIVETEPIFKLFNNQGLELFRELIKKIYEKDETLGELFQSKIRYKSFENSELIWETMLDKDEKELLKDNWNVIKTFVHRVFGSEVKIKGKTVDNIDIKRNKKLNEPIIESKKEKNIYIEKIIKQKFSDKKIEYKFQYKNILLKGVPGTGKSRTLENIINNHLNLKEHYNTNVRRVNIHSSSSNSDLMQGIAINSNDGHIEYKEKQGLILELIERATFNPNQPFVLVLEEIQENSLNELIGDLIYLIEDSKRAEGYKADNEPYTYSGLIDEIMNQNVKIDSVKLPSLISKQEKIKRMIIPHNLFIFCTSNYRDDRKVIEDNLLRRFDVIEIYPKSREEIGKDEAGNFIFVNKNISNFLEALNKSIIEICRTNGEIHPDRFMIGHSIWLNVKDKKAFSRAFLKVITEFKDVKDMHFDDFKKITDKLDFPFELEKEYESYEEWIKVLQKECYSFLSDN